MPDFINPNGYSNPYEFRYKPNTPSLIQANYSKLPIGKVNMSMPKFDLGTRPNSYVPVVGEKSNFIDKLSPYSGQLRAAVGLGANLNAVNKMDTNVESRLVSNSPFTYTNRSAFLKNRNQASFRNFMNNRNGVPVNDTQAYAATLKADNDISIAEGQRQDAAVQDFNNRNLQVNATNVETINRNNYINNALKNSKYAQKGAAYSSYLENLDTLELQKNTQEKDLLGLKILAKAGEQGRAAGMFDQYLKPFLKN